LDETPYFDRYDGAVDSNQGNSGYLHTGAVVPKECPNLTLDERNGPFIVIRWSRQLLRLLPSAASLTLFEMNTGIRTTRALNHMVSSVKN